ncbi:MAG TPA: DUF3105 domain-containing protein [Actinomycetes bacterium]|nr:DUF3105 domain-containing protein [Actinomycetes bacterium]
MGSNAQRRREEREKKVAQLRKADQSRQRRSTTLLTIGLVIAVVVAIGGVWWAVEAGTEDPTPGALDDVQTYDYTGSDHTESDGIPVDYEESPPVGGRHSPVWLDCTGVVYDEPVASEQAVHALEHGAVWITYDPSLPQGDVDTLADQIDGSYIFLSPYEDQNAPVVATAWNNQLELDGVDDPRLDDFITEFRQGQQTPEPGAPCNPPSGQ